MPEPLISPAWEYWVGDPEIEELLAEAARPARAFDLLGDEGRYDSPGLRFGSGGRPDAFAGRLAPEPPPPGPRDDARVRGKGRCRGCGAAFTKRRPEQRYCTRACSPRPGRPRLRPAELVCRACGVRFEPAENHPYLYCSRKCADPRRTGRKPRKKETL